MVFNPHQHFRPERKPTQPGVGCPGIEVETTEVESVPQLEKVLDEISPDTLLWPNAYYDFGVRLRRETSA